MDSRKFLIDQDRQYGLEILGPDGALIWKTDSDSPFIPVAVGDRVQALDAKGARPEVFHQVLSVRHVMWTDVDVVQCLTPPAHPAGRLRRLIAPLRPR